MTDVSKVQGPSGPPEGPKKKEEIAPDTGKFEEVHKKVKQVSGIDPEEHKKRKQQAEEEEEEQVDPQAGPATPPEHVTPFSLEQGAKKANLSDLQKEGPGTSPVKSTKQTPRTAFTTRRDPVPPITEPSHGTDNEPPSSSSTGFKVGPPQTAPPTSPQIQKEKWTPEGQKPVTPGPPGSEQQKPSPTPATPSEKKKPGAHQGPGVSEKKLTAGELEEPSDSKGGESSAFFEQLGEKEKKAPEEIGAEGAAQGIEGLTPPPSPPQTLGEKEEKKIKETEKLPPVEQVIQPGEPMREQPILSPAPLSPQPLSPYAYLHPQVQELFDRMVGVMTVMNLSGMTETAITLNTPQFASSVFFGTQIIIQEFSTAPQAFNIQLSGSPQAVALFQNHAEDLMAAFQAGHYAFRVNRFETGYLADRPLFKRKEKVSGEDQDQKGDSPP